MCNSCFPFSPLVVKLDTNAAFSDREELLKKLETWRVDDATSIDTEGQYIHATGDLCLFDVAELRLLPGVAAVHSVRDLEADFPGE